jgi:hypothetical protein
MVYWLKTSFSWEKGEMGKAEPFHEFEVIQKRRHILLTQVIICLFIFVTLL